MSIYDKMLEFWDSSKKLEPGQEFKALEDLVMILLNCTRIVDNEGQREIPHDAVMGIKNAFLERIEQRLPGFTADFFEPEEPQSPTSVGEF